MRQLIAVIAALAVSAGLTLAAAGTAGAGVAARGGKSAAPALAKAVARAKTTAARVNSIDKIMAVLHVDVISPENGAVVVKGAARSLNDAYLYTSEVEHLALGYAARDRVTFKTLADEVGLAYTKLGVHLTGENLGAGVEKVIRAESKGSVKDPVALLARLVWQLGLLDKPAQDLAKKIPVGKVRLDPLQAWLITAEFTFPLIYAHPPSAAASSRLAALTDGLVKHGAAPSNVCEDLKALKESLGFSDKMVMSTVEGILGKTFNWAALLQSAGKNLAPLIDTVHGVLTGIGIEITSVIHPAKTELGGPDMFLAVGVFMHLHLPKVLVDCGWLSGDDFPGHGAVPGVTVSWDNGTLASWGSFRCDGCHKTGPLGTAAETFTPGPEEVHHGTKIIERGDVTAYTLVNFSMGNKLGFLGDVVRDQGHMIWELSHHKTGFPIGFTADVHSIAGPSYTTHTVSDFTLTAVRTKIKGFCDPKKETSACYYTVTHIQGKATVYAKYNEIACTAKMPPFGITNDYIDISDGKTRHSEWYFSFTATSATGPCTEGIIVAIGTTAGPVYEFGETDAHFTPNGNEGTAVVHWIY
jgi:hypothetical protein